MIELTTYQRNAVNELKQRLVQMVCQTTAAPSTEKGGER
mgnify:CR=1 FL=1